MYKKGEWRGICVHGCARVKYLYKCVKDKEKARILER